MKFNNPKTFVTILFFGLMGSVANAHDIVEFLATETCTCLRELKEVGPIENPQADLVKCLEAVLEENLESGEEIFGEGFLDKFENPKAFEEAIGKQMAKDCEDFVEIFSQRSRDQNTKEMEFFKEGEAHLAAGEWDDAIAAYGAAISLNPQMPVYHNQRGVVYSEKGDYYRTISDFYRAIELLPTYNRPFHNMAFSKYTLRDYRLALGDVEEAIKIDP